MARPKPKDEPQAHAAGPAKTDGASKRSFLVMVGCDYGDGYNPPGTVITGVPAALAPVWVAEGVLVPDGETPTVPLDVPSNVVTYAPGVDRLDAESEA